MWELDHKEDWVPKDWCFWIVVLEKTLESPVDHNKNKAVSPKWNQPWILMGRTDAEAEAPILWPSDVKSRLTGKDPDAWKEWRQKEKGAAEDEMVGWPHWLNGREIEQTPGDGEGQGSLVCCNPSGCKESDMTEWLNWNDWKCTLRYGKPLDLKNEKQWKEMFSGAPERNAAKLTFCF